MEHESISSIFFAGMFGVFVGMASSLIFGNLLLLILRFSHSEDSKMADIIRMIGRHLSFLRLGGKNSHDLQDHA